MLRNIVRVEVKEALTLCPPDCQQEKRTNLEDEDVQVEGFNVLPHWVIPSRLLVFRNQKRKFFQDVFCQGTRGILEECTQYDNTLQCEFISSRVMMDKLAYLPTYTAHVSANCLREGEAALESSDERHLNHDIADKIPPSGMDWTCNTNGCPIFYSASKEHAIAVGERACSS